MYRVPLGASGGVYERRVGGSKQKKNERGRALSTHGRIHRRRRSEKETNTNHTHSISESIYYYTTTTAEETHLQKMLLRNN